MNQCGCVISKKIAIVLWAVPAVAWGECPIFPADNIWNAPANQLPVEARSSAYIQSIGSNTGLHPDFGSGIWDGGPIGIPYNTVSSTQPKVPIAFDYADESDSGPYPIPSQPLIEHGSDHHSLIVDKDHCLLYETWDTRQGADGTWQAGSGAIFDLRSNALRPSGWTSADAAGLPILPGLARCEELAAGVIKHALRFTAQRTQRKYVWPARHYASSITDPNTPPMGQRFRLKSDFNLSGYSPQTQIILTALKTYGMILADNGSNWYISGAPGACWDDESLVAELRTVTGNHFEAVDSSGLMVDPNSAQVRQSALATAIGVFRNGQWVLDANGNGAWDGCGIEFCFSGFGQTGDLPAAGNWDGGARSYIGVLRSGAGQWFIDRNGNRQWDGCVADGCYSGFGQAGDLPAAGDWNGAGFAKIGVFRNGQWFLDANNNGQWDRCSVDLCLSFGQAGDLPVAGNWNGGVPTGVGVFRAGTWYLDFNGNGKWDGCQQDGGQDKCFYNSFGQDGDLPTAGDWNGDGNAKVGVFRAGTWYLDYNGNGVWDGCGVDRCYVGSFGQAGDWPVAGKW